MRMHHGKNVLAAAVLAAAAFAGNASAEVITVAIEANVVSIDDYNGYLGGAVHVGDKVTGTYTYNTATPDANVMSQVGDYWHSSSAYGIQLYVNGLRFRTRPTAVNFLVEIVNDYYGDAYLLRSYNNLFDISAPAGIFPANNHISWQLDDFSMQAISGTQLTPKAPQLPAWQSIFGLDISSDGSGPGYSSFLIRSKVTRAEVIGVAACRGCTQ